jgi:hypothetical protein
MRSLLRAEIVKPVLAWLGIPARAVGVDDVAGTQSRSARACRTGSYVRRRADLGDQERHPELYIGLPGQKVPKQEGREVMKQRRMRLAQPLSPSQAVSLVEALQAMMCIKAIAVKHEESES